MRLRHFVAYVRGGALMTSNISQGRPECANASMMVENQSCLKVLYPPPPPPPPPLPADTNPLAGLPALPKPHYSWYRSRESFVASDHRLGPAGCCTCTCTVVMLLNQPELHWPQTPRTKLRITVQR